MENVRNVDPGDRQMPLLMRFSTPCHPPVSARLRQSHRVFADFNSCGVAQVIVQPGQRIPDSEYRPDDILRATAQHGLG